MPVEDAIGVAPHELLLDVGMDNIDRVHHRLVFPGPYDDARTRHGREEQDSRVFSVPVLRGTDSHHDDRSTPRSGQQQRKSSASRVKLRNENSGVAWKLTFIVAKCDRPG